MKRDMDLVREILLAVEAAPENVDRHVVVEGRDHTVVQLHVKLLEQAGLLGPSGYIMVKGNRMGLGSALTWEGHEFLETIRDPEIWRKTQSSAKSVGSWSLSLIGELAKGLAKQKAIELGFPLG